VIPAEPQKNDRREGNPIYTRNYGRADRGGRYNPPPGYDGNAFSEPPAVKMHRATDELVRLPQNSPETPPLPQNSEEILDLLQEEHPTEDMTDSPSEENEASGERKPSPAEIRTKPTKEEESSGTPDAVPVFAGGIQSLEALFRHLRGKFGREELIIVLVMLLVSSEGASPELILLALLLIAG